MHCAIDVGHGYVKAVSATGKRTLFPSWIAPIPEGPQMGRFDRQDVVTVNDGAYWVGNAARHYATSLFSHDKATDPLTLALTWIAADQVMDSDRIVQLGVGLPLSWYGSQKDALATALTGSVTVGSQALVVEQVQVFPQAVGALVSIADFPVTGLIGLVDIGYRTVDYLIAQVNEGVPRPLPTTAGTYPGGVHVAYQAMARTVEKDWHVHFEPHELVQRPTVTVHGQPMGLDPYRNSALQTLAEDLARHLAIYWDGVQEKLDALYLAGGGAQDLQAYWPDWPGLTVLPQSQWANAQGYLRLL